MSGLILNIKSWMSNVFFMIRHFLTPCTVEKRERERVLFPMMQLVERSR